MMPEMSQLINSLVTVNQLYKRIVNNDLPPELQESIRFYTARLTQAAGVLLRLPQSITAQANVIIFRYWTVDDVMQHEFSEISAAALFLVTKTSASPRSLRSITNVYAYLLSPGARLADHPVEPLVRDHYYVPEAMHAAYCVRILHLEGQILLALGFTLHVALPHALSITYLQALDLFSDADVTMGRRMAQRTLAYLNSALLSPQMLYLTHQPHQLATAAVYMAARDCGLVLPACAWWEVFDCEREDLGFLVNALTSLEPLVARVQRRWGPTKNMISRRDVLAQVGGSERLGESLVLEEEQEMAMILDEKVAATATTTQL